MLKLALILTALSFIACGNPSAGSKENNAYESILESDTNGTVEFIIRPGSDGEWFLLENETHRTLGVIASGVSTNENYINVSYIEAFDFVYYFACVPDETLIKLGYSVGVSGGGSHMRIYLRQEGSSSYTNPHTIDNLPWANINCFAHGGWE